uniref:Uncharacterized protein n=1 Tax=Arundo donax TaxID=35708 RepID=A0A0A9DA91_ARUDO
MATTLPSPTDARYTVPNTPRPISVALLSSVSAPPTKSSERRLLPGPNVTILPAVSLLDDFVELVTTLSSSFSGTPASALRRADMLSKVITTTPRMMTTAAQMATMADTLKNRRFLGPPAPPPLVTRLLSPPPCVYSLGSSTSGLGTFILHGCVTSGLQMPRLPSSALASRLWNTPDAGSRPTRRLCEMLTARRFSSPPSCCGISPHRLLYSSRKISSFLSSAMPAGIGPVKPLCPKLSR